MYAVWAPTIGIPMEPLPDGGMLAIQCEKVEVSPFPVLECIAAVFRR